MSDAVFELVLKRLNTVYGEAKTDDIEAYLSEFSRALNGFSNKILERAVSKVIREHKYPTWPTVGEVVAAANKVAEDHAPQTVREPEPKFESKTDAEKASVKSVIGRFTASMNVKNSFPDIAKRCPIGGSIDMRAPWGEEVKDQFGNIVPIRA